MKSLLRLLRLGLDRQVRKFAQVRYAHRPFRILRNREAGQLMRPPRRGLVDRHAFARPLDHVAQHFHHLEFPGHTLCTAPSDGEPWVRFDMRHQQVAPGHADDLRHYRGVDNVAGLGDSQRCLEPLDQVAGVALRPGHDSILPPPARAAALGRA